MTPSRSAGQSPFAKLASIVAMGICAAMAAGLVHHAQLAITDHWFGAFRWFSREFVWMAPISYGVVLVPGAVAIGCVAALDKRRDWFPFAVACLVTVAVFGVLLPFSQIGRPPALVLALGVGVTMSRAMRRNSERWAGWSRRAALISLVTLPAMAAVQRAVRGLAESRALAALPAGATDVPDVLLVVLDAARAKSLGLVNPSVGTTPRLDAWASSGAVFERAFSTAPWTLPSHASMLSGRYPGEMDADWTVPVGADHPVLPELLRAGGYATAGFVANLHYAGWDSGLMRGFVHYDDYVVDWPQTLRSSAFTQTSLADTLIRVPRLATLRNFLHPDLSIVPQHRYRTRLGAEVIDTFLSWQSAHEDRPYFALINLMDPHLITSAPNEERRRYPHAERGESDYLAAMRYLDGEVDRLLSTLQQRGKLDRTLVIITADHGELLGEHGLDGHAKSLYKDVLHVPLFLRLPGVVPAGSRVARAVSLRDLAATVLDLTGVSRTALPGTSLAGVWRDSSATLSPVIAEVRRQPNPLGDYPTASGDLSAVFNEQMYYIRNHGTGQEQLFAYATDSGEVVDHAKGPTAQQMLVPWREQLAKFRHDRYAPGPPR